jgi:hypothetical protein
MRPLRKVISVFKKLLAKNELRIRVTPADQDQTESIEIDDSTPVDPEQIAKITKDVLKHVTIAVGSIIVLVGAVATIREVTVKKTKSADNE